MMSAAARRATVSHTFPRLPTDSRVPLKKDSFSFPRRSTKQLEGTLSTGKMRVIKQH